MGTDTAWASRYTENNHGNSPNPPRSATIDGTAVARIVASTAISAVESIIASSTGPRSERRPTPAVVTAVTIGCKTRRPLLIPPAADLTPLVGPDRRPADGTGGIVVVLRRRALAGSRAWTAPGCWTRWAM